MKSDIICVSETWLIGDSHTRLQLPGFTLVLNNAGRGKGAAIYYRSTLIICGTVKINHHDCQIIKVITEDIDIVSVYRSASHSIVNLTNELNELIDSNRTTVVCGDFNLNALESELHLQDQHFHQVVNVPTYIQGSILDHVYTNTEPEYVHVHPVYYSDHDATCVIVPRRR